ncbi:hypothetical protein DPEC_G00305930 [Dallia pectoralis]|uniref:Uncharacterized protein n=1 Tax=Dallia pectoralis TaxID=75939 RepID=A0ACC2FE08_DALPE|nr:hypothetical protein DPEC_G00305930 [Dallia pectoralis]
MNGHGTTDTHAFLLKLFHSPAWAPPAGYCTSSRVLLTKHVVPFRRSKIKPCLERILLPLRAVPPFPALPEVGFPPRRLFLRHHTAQTEIRSHVQCRQNSHGLGTFDTFRLSLYLSHVSVQSPEQWKSMGDA